MSVYLYLFHGRATPDEDVEDWGCEGPAIGPLDYVHTTYGSEVKIRGAKAVLEKYLPGYGNSFPRRLRRTRHSARRRLSSARRQILR